MSRDKKQILKRLAYTTILSLSSIYIKRLKAVCYIYSLFDN